MRAEVRQMQAGVECATEPILVAHSLLVADSVGQHLDIGRGGICGHAVRSNNDAHGNEG
jgi:hypothetical protein